MADIFSYWLIDTISLLKSSFLYIFNNSILQAVSKEEIVLDKEKFIEVCPVCGNADLYYEAGGYGGAVYHCKECGYVGAFVIEANEEMIEEIREKYRREKVSESNKSSGRE
mgnify:FL=1